MAKITYELWKKGGRLPSRRRAKIIAEEILPCLTGAKTILDFGCGNMLISKYIFEKSNKKIKITGLDVIDLNMTDLNHVLYDGKKIPFKDKQFDVVIAIFALHHTGNPKEMLKECIRVARSKVILAEDIYQNRIEEIITKGADWIITHFALSQDMQSNFLSINEWKEEFLKNNLRLAQLKRIDLAPLFPIKIWVPFELVIEPMTKNHQKMICVESTCVGRDKEVTS